MISVDFGGRSIFISLVVKRNIYLQFLLGTEINTNLLYLFDFDFCFGTFCFLNKKESLFIHSILPLQELPLYFTISGNLTEERQHGNSERKITETFGLFPLKKSGSFFYPCLMDRCREIRVNTFFFFFLLQDIKLS